MAARAEITPTQITRQGADLPAQTTGVVADGHKFRNNGAVTVEVENVSADTNRAITFNAPDPDDDLVVTVAFGTVVAVGPFPPAKFNMGDDMVYVDYEAAHESDLKVRVLRLEP